MSSPEAQPPRYRILSHTADTAIEAWGDDLAELIANTAAGMFALMYDPASIAATRQTEITVSAEREPDLVVDALAELLYLSEADDLALSRFQVSINDNTVQIRAQGGPLQQVKLHGPPIKAVTYHDLTVEHTADGWHARVVFDV